MKPEEEMPDFLARVQLPDVPGERSFETYEKLHGALERAGFFRVIKGSMATWRLPDATYIGTFELSSPDVRDKIVRAVSSISQKAQVMVVQYQHAAWTGLPKA
jgi:hypothetical protein